MPISEAFNFRILSAFYQIERVEQDKDTLLKRCQALLIIYVNLATLIALLLWNSYFLIGLPVPSYDINLALIGLPTLSLICMKKKKVVAAMTIVLIYCHLAIYGISLIEDCSLASLPLVQGVNILAFYLTPRSTFHQFNVGLCFIQNVLISRRLLTTFATTFTEEQSVNIMNNNLASFLYLFIFTVVSYNQRNFQDDLLEIICSHSNRTQKISQELMQALKAKDMFVNSLSHEIRNPLNAMKGSIDYLRKTVQDPTQQQVLENAYLSSEVLLQLLNNVLDAAKLKGDKMELLYSETKPTDIVKKVMATHSDRIKEKQMTTEIQMDKKIPKKLWIDSSRLMQIVMNLFSNALKFTPEKGKIQITASWLSINESKEKLLSPFHRTYKKQVPNQEYKNADRDNGSSQGLTSGQSTARTKNVHEISSDLTVCQSHLEYSIQGSSAPYCKMQNRKFTTNSTKLGKLSTQENNLASRKFSGFTTMGRVETEELLSPDQSPDDSRNKGYLKIEITDNGPGISPDILPTLFTMFNQGGKDVASIHGGSGLGLWICKELCQKMGGDIAIYSELNKGTSLVFYVAIDNSNIQFAHSLSFKTPNTKKKNVRSLVVDDYAYNRDIHKLLLEREGVRVSMACDGKEALEKYIMDGEGYYDFILMDIQMPEMDGFTAFRKIREWEVKKNWRKVHVYFVSGNYYNEQELLAELQSHGQMDDYGEVKCLRKPIDVAAVTKIVDQFSHSYGESTP